MVESPKSSANTRQCGGGGLSGWLEGAFLNSALMRKKRARTSGDDVWSSHDASIAFRNGHMNSLEKTTEDWASSTSLRVAFRNKSRHNLILSWVDQNGKCHHFYSLKPAKVLEGPVTALDYTENTFLGDSFCIAYVKDKKEEDKMRDSKIIDPNYVIGGYRPCLLPSMPTCENNKERNGKNKNVHLVTISQVAVQTRRKDDDDDVCCFAPSPIRLRGSSKLQQEVESIDNTDIDDDRMIWVVKAEESVIDENQIDTSEKVYVKQILGGWPVYVEPTLFEGDTQLEQKLSEDLEWASKRLPPHARAILKENCPVWINKSLCWGPEICPIKGRGLCFHPGSDFLHENLMNKEKACCVEMYNAKEYYSSDSSHWGKGGVFIHEFAHAYHHQVLDKGYDNPEIIDCYNRSVNEDRLYDWVRVHGPQGPMNKAYACTNAMEYFAELSAAFLGQPDLTSTEDFNKWYPFNRRHVKEHDPRAYQLLNKLWKLSDEEDNG